MSQYSALLQWHWRAVSQELQICHCPLNSTDALAVKFITPDLDVKYRWYCKPWQSLNVHSNLSFTGADISSPFSGSFLYDWYVIPPPPQKNWKKRPASTGCWCKWNMDTVCELIGSLGADLYPNILAVSFATCDAQKLSSCPCLLDSMNQLQYNDMYTCSFEPVNLLVVVCSAQHEKFSELLSLWQFYSHAVWGPPICYQLSRTMVKKKCCTASSLLFYCYKCALSYSSKRV